MRPIRQQAGGSSSNDPATRYRRHYRLPFPTTAWTKWLPGTLCTTCFPQQVVQRAPNAWHTPGAAVRPGSSEQNQIIMTTHFHLAEQRPLSRFRALHHGFPARGPSAWRFRAGLYAALLIGCLAAVLPGEALADIRIDNAWTRATVSTQRASGAFMTITSDTAARLVGVHSPVAGIAEIHEMTVIDNIMRMRAIDSLALPAGTAVTLKPGGYHLMLLDLKSALQEGEQIPLTLTIEDDDGTRKDITVQAEVRALTARSTDHGGAMGTAGHGHDHTGH